MENSSFFNSVNGDRVYDADLFAKFFKKFLSTGVYHTDNVPYLKVTASALISTIEPGSAYIEGYMYENTENIKITHPKADNTNPRIDRVVLRLDRTVGSRFVKAFLKTGDPSNSPQPPVLQRDEYIYEISLASVRVNAGTTMITSVTDERYDEAVCGLVSSLITVPMDEFQRQWDEWFTGRQNDVGIRLFTGIAQPLEGIAGDVWLKVL